MQDPSVEHPKRPAENAAPQSAPPVKRRRKLEQQELSKKRPAENAAPQSAPPEKRRRRFADLANLPVPQVSNVVSTFTCNTTLDLLKISQRHGLEFQPSRFAACSIRLGGDSDRSTALAFTSGKFVITGCTSEMGSLKASREYVHLLAKLGERLNFCNYKVQNIVSSVDMGYPLDLKRFQDDLTALTSWESRKFPGLVFRHASGLVALCFRSGKLVLTGAKSRRSLMENWPKVHDVVAKYLDRAQGATKCSREYSKQLRREEEKQPFVGGSLFGGLGLEMI